MIVYSGTKEQFSDDVFSNVIEKKILDAFQHRTGHSTSKSEIESWKNSMQYMNNVLVSASIPDDAGVAIEYKIPLTSKRVGVLPEYWTNDMLGFPPTEENQYEEEQIYR